MKVTELLAIYAAALSTAVFFWNIAKSKPKVKVKIIAGTMKEEDDNYQAGIYILVQNSSAHTVHISQVTVAYQYTDTKLKEFLRHLYRFKSFPSLAGWCHTGPYRQKAANEHFFSVEPGKSHDIFVSQEKLEKILEDAAQRKIKAVAQDELWRRKYSSSYEVRRLPRTMKSSSNS